MNRRLLVALLAIVSLSVAACGGPHPNDLSVKTGTSAAMTAAPGACPKTWARADSNKGGNRWFANGVPAIQAASNETEARAAAREWLKGVRTDPVLLAGAAQFLVHREVNQAELFDRNGCAAQHAVDLVAELEAALALSKVAPSEAPAGGYNSGTSGGVVVGAANPGVTGNRKAVLIEMPDGTKIWIMARCGNPVTEGKPSVPSGPTDNPPVTHVCVAPKPWGTWPHCYGAKDPGKDPAPQGNVPTPVQGTAPPVSGPASPPAAGHPPSTYNPPTPPTATTVPRTVPPNEGGGEQNPVPTVPGGGTGCDPRVCDG